MRIFLFTILALVGFSCKPKVTLKEQLQEIVAHKNAKVGIAILNLQTGETTEINGNDRFPMQSVFKYHIAAKALDDVDKGIWKLNEHIAVKATELLPNTWSPLREELGIKDTQIRLDTLIYNMVSNSDNNACDIILRRIGGPEAVNLYFKNMGIENLNIVFNEEDMQKEWGNQFENYSSPLAMVEVLDKFYNRKYLSGDQHNFLFAQLVNTTTGKNRLSAGVSSESTIAHKTGTSGRNSEGISAATNDAGFIILPDGKVYIVAVFVSDSKETDEINEKIIADVARVLSKIK